jgi:hypothetical protein
MTSLKITLWYNELDSELEAFAQTFSIDLQKCLTRFGVQGDISLNTDSKDFAYGIILMSNSENNPQFVSKTESLNQLPNILVISIEPIDMVSSAFKLNTTYHFWEKIYTTGETRLYRRNNPETRLSYWEKITDIATGFSDKMIQSTKQNKGFVYLSQNELSHGAERDNLVRDLNDLGFEVLPNKPLNSDIIECTEQIEQALNLSQLIIHIIPPIYSTFFVHQHLSIAEHQCNISAEFVKKKAETPRVIWIPSAYEITDEENQVFIEKIQRDKDQTEQTTVLKSSIEDLKKLYRMILSNSFQKTDNTNNADVYLIFDSEDKALLQKCTEVLSKNKDQVVTNQNGITYNQHISRLAVAKTVVLSYSGMNEKWLFVKTNDILKARGVDKYKPFEKVVLININNHNTNMLPNVFTHILSDPKELESI